MAKTHQEAIYASSLVKIELDFTTKPILNLDDAYEQKSFLEDPMILEKGNVKKDMSKSNYTLSGNFEIGGQDHFYLETHVALFLERMTNTLCGQVLSILLRFNTVLERY